MARRARVLLVEDTPTQAEIARAYLSDQGHELRVAETGAEGLRMARDWAPDAILIDVELPDFDGFELMRRLTAAEVTAIMIVITAQGSVNTAVTAMREGAIDFIVKPYAKARLTVTLANALEQRRLSVELAEARAIITRDRFFGFIGGSPAMQAVYRTIQDVAASRANVFITGESGTGKELAAEAIHRASPRAKMPFVPLNCGAIPATLIESEVFGHKRGAFTGATEDRPGAARSADGGTLFLDEIGETPPDMQVKLLRFVQTGTVVPVGSSKGERVDVRVVSATNRDPLAEVEAGRFREDLYYRLYVVPIHLPPLRERGEDVLMIARHFLGAYGREERRKFRGFAPDAEAVLLGSAWPGNVRQLQNVIRNLVVRHDGDLATAAMLPADLLRAARPIAVPVAPLAPAATSFLSAVALPAVAPLMEIPAALAELPANDPLASIAAALAALVSARTLPAPPEPSQPRPERRGPIIPLWQMEKEHILAALEECGQDVPRAAALLEINPSTIYRKLQGWRV
ncbi:two-component system repressor protein LuxO [Humitalea rosea]|uniref:Two-component system repressor protein LuxO n=1 Tax=Humitalea rosea TaxID=990373 RepID=A0A2W7IGB7_9PROT|nr:sigma-54 dependent transcriptional regulator [Humitalea rosea]PZW45616.1 two-component system repressor protein LuxO [Humitalea rosea]